MRLLTLDITKYSTIFRLGFRILLVWRPYLCWHVNLKRLSFSRVADRIRRQGKRQAATQYREVTWEHYTSRLRKKSKTG